MRRDVNNGPHPDCAKGPITQSHTTGRQFTGYFSLVITCLVFAANARACHKQACARTLCALPRNDPIKSAMCGISFGRTLQTRRLKSALSSALSRACKPAPPPRLTRPVPPVPFHPAEFDAEKKKIVGGKKKQQKYKWEGGRLHAETQPDTSFVSRVKSERDDETPDCSVAERYPFSRVQLNHLHVRVSNFIMLSLLCSLTPLS